MPPADPRCPECDGPLSATASYCMHCEADLPAGPIDAAGAADTEAPRGEEAFADDARASTDDPRATRGDPSPGEQTGWLDPDGLLDDASTVAVGLVAGVLAGVVTSVALVWALPGVLPFLVGLSALVGAALYVARTRTVFGATRKAGYLLAGLLAALPPLFAFTAEMQENTLGERVGLLVVLAVFVGPVALALAGVGYLAGKRASG